MNATGFEAVVRTLTLAWALAAAALLVLRAPRSVATACAAFCAAGVAAFVTVSWDAAFASLGVAAFLLDAACLASPFAFWMLARALFDDGFVPSRATLAAAAVALVALAAAEWGRFALGVLGAWPALSRALFLSLRAASLVLVAHGILQALAGWRGDLVDARRKARALFALLAGGAFVATVASSFAFPQGAPQAVRLPALMLLAAATLVLLLIVGTGTLHARLREVLAPVAAPREALRAVTAVDAALARRAVEAMEKEALWRQERLSLGGLARHLAVPEYRLRRAINAHLGHRSFSAFVCGYRLQAAARLLEDPARAATPILSIALDCGFASVGPFNRAFRARFGVAPRDYRASRVGGHAAAAPFPRIGETPLAR